MALSQSELMRLLESLRRADGVEAISVVCERILQELIEAEATEVIGAAPREHSETHTCTVSPPARSTTWSKPWGQTAGSPSPRSPGSAVSWMRN